jgi:hypothetical protein
MKNKRSVLVLRNTCGRNLIAGFTRPQEGHWCGGPCTVFLEFSIFVYSKFGEYKLQTPNDTYLPISL